MSIKEVRVTTQQESRMPAILPAQADEQIVFMRKGGTQYVFDGKPVEGPVVGTKGGIQYVVGEKDSSFMRESPEDLRRVLRLSDHAAKGLLLASTPAEIYKNGVDGDRSKLCLVFTSGGEGSSIGVNIARVASEIGSKHVVLGAWQGFESGIKSKDEFGNSLTVINDQRVLERLRNTGGSPFGMSRTKIEKDSPAEKQLVENCDGVGMVYGTGGGDHTKNFKKLSERLKASGKKTVVGVTPKSMDNDLAITLDDGSTVNSLMLGYPSTAHIMRRHWFDEMQSAAGAGRPVVGFFFGRGAGWTVLGAMRCDEEYANRMKEDGVLTPDLENKMDSLVPKQIGLVPEFPVSIGFFVKKVNEVYARGRDKFAGIAVSEGFMFKELDQEYKRITSGLENGRLKKEEVLELSAKGDFDKLIEDPLLREVFKKKRDIAKEFFKVVADPELDGWGHPYIKIMPKIVDAVVTTLTNAKKTNYVEIKYEARTGESIPSDRRLAEKTGALAAEKLKEGESGLTTVTYKDGEDPLLIDITKRKPTFIPFERITAMTEKHNNLTTLNKDYLRRLGILIED
jgi:6-phosphofructokinase